MIEDFPQDQQQTSEAVNQEQRVQDVAGEFQDAGHAPEYKPEGEHQEVKPTDSDAEPVHLTFIDHNEPTDKRVQDVEKARAMAEASSKDRTSAALSRKDAHSTSYNDSRWQYESDAKLSDRIASAKEEWAGILHDKAPSQAYVDAHPGIDFSAEHLLYMDEVSTYDLEKVENAKSSLAAINAIGAIFGSDRRDRDSMSELVLGDDEATEAWEALIANPQTTLAQITDFYKPIFTDKRINPMISHANASRIILDDIRSGRATTT